MGALVMVVVLALLIGSVCRWLTNKRGVHEPTLITAREEEFVEECEVPNEVKAALRVDGPAPGHR